MASDQPKNAAYLQPTKHTPLAERRKGKQTYAKPRANLCTSWFRLRQHQMYCAGTSARSSCVAHQRTVSQAPGYQGTYIVASEAHQPVKNTSVRGRGNGVGDALTYPPRLPSTRCSRRGALSHKPKGLSVNKSLCNTDCVMSLTLALGYLVRPRIPGIQRSARTGMTKSIHRVTMDTFRR